MINTINWLDDYLKKQKEIINNIDLKQINGVIDVLYEAYKNSRQIFVAGNGGSASNASHFSTDLGKCASDSMYVSRGNRFKVISLNENVSWMTAIGNDYAYEDIFIRQLINYANRDDVLMLLGVSGNSPNIIRTAEWAMDNGLYIIGFMGEFDGKLKKYADECIIIKDNHYGRVEDVEMIICHLLCYAFKELIIQ